MPVADDDPLRDRAKRTYILVIICEAVVIAALWAFERMFS
jgi:hypothetical protein